MNVYTPLMTEEHVKSAQHLLEQTNGSGWLATQFLRFDGEPIQTVADVAQTVAFSSSHSDRAELFGVVNSDGQVVCYTGNGPTSDMSALLVASAPTYAAIALRQHFEIGMLRVALAALLDEVPADTERARAIYEQTGAFPKELPDSIDYETFGPTPEDWGVLFADTTGFPSAEWAGGFFKKAIELALRDRDRAEALSDMAKDDTPVIAVEDAVKQAEDAAIAEFINDLRSFTPEEIDRELKEANDDLEEIEPWVEALTAWKRRGYKAEA